MCAFAEVDWGRFLGEGGLETALAVYKSGRRGSGRRSMWPWGYRVEGRTQRRWGGGGGEKQALEVWVSSCLYISIFRSHVPRCTQCSCLLAMQTGTVRLPDPDKTKSLSLRRPCPCKLSQQMESYPQTGLLSKPKPKRHTMPRPNQTHDQKKTPFTAKQQPPPQTPPAPTSSPPPAHSPRTTSSSPAAPSSPPPAQSHSSDRPSPCSARDRKSRPA